MLNINPEHLDELLKEYKDPQDLIAQGWIPRPLGRL
jgi:hypothetical protein